MRANTEKYPKVIVTGSEGLLGKTICESLNNDYEIIKLDIKLGHDLSNEDQVKEILQKHKNSYGLVNLFAINPQPNEDSQKLEDLSIHSLRDCQISLSPMLR